MRKHPQPAEPTQCPSLWAEPKLGIFWLVGNRLVLASTPLAKAESHGEFRNFPASHIDHWAELQRDGSVPGDMEYEESPRGRVIYDATTQQFTLFADRCIIKDKRLVGRIMKELNLPRNTKVLRDDHYRCARCMGRR